MKQLKSFYDFNVNSPEERLERNRLFPELAKFHISLREELSEAEYEAFFNSEKESFKQLTAQNQPNNRTWISA